MQPLDAPPRDHLTAAEVTAVLTGDHLHTDFGAEVLNLDLTVNTDYGTGGDISADVAGGGVERQMHNRIHGTCRLDLETELPWGSVLVRPYMLLSSQGVEARFNCGVYMLTTPETRYGTDPIVYSAQGMDRVYLLDREVGEDYTILEGVTYYDALVAVFADAGLTGYLIDGDALDHTLPVDREWPLVGTSTDPDQTDSPVTWLRIVNDLLAAVNFRGVWADEHGIYRCQAYQAPTDRSPEFTFDADDIAVSIVGEDPVLAADLYKSPNRWVFLWSNRPDGPQAVEGDGMYTVDNVADGPSSQEARGLVWPKVFEYEAASQTVLESLGDRRVADDMRASSAFSVTTAPFPAAGHFDVFTYTDARTGGTRKVLATSWSFDLDGSDVEWRWEVI